MFSLDATIKLNILKLNVLKQKLKYLYIRFKYFVKIQIQILIFKSFYKNITHHKFID